MELNQPTCHRSGDVRHQLEFGEAGGIELGKGYTVRVRAVNAAGPGPWSVETDQLICRYKALKPKVTFRGPKEITLKAGETLSLAVDIQVSVTFRFTLKKLARTCKTIYCVTFSALRRLS